MFKAPSSKILSTLGLVALLTGCVTDDSGMTPWPGMGHSGNVTATNTTYSIPSSSERTAGTDRKDLPALIVTNDPPPDVIYRRGSRDTILADTEHELESHDRFKNRDRVETLVTRKVGELSRDLHELQRETASYDNRLMSLQRKSDEQAGDYYTLVASINAQLQSGTTPGNPLLIEKWNAAQEKLNNLSHSAGQLNDLATDLSNAASKAAFLLEATRATFSLSGAVEEDHEQLTRLEDEVNQTIVHLNRLLNQVNDEINRRTTYLRSERLNMQTLSLSISKGELYGKSLTNSLFKRAAEDGGFITSENSAADVKAQGRRPLVIIRFDRQNVEYEQALYTAISQALEKYPSAKFDLVAVSPISGNAAESALASSDARKNGEAVLRSLIQMGLPMERIRLNAAQSRDVLNSEVHIYIQ